MMRKQEKRTCRSGRQLWRRTLAAVMAAAMVLTALPQSALMVQAEEPDTEQVVTTEQDATVEETMVQTLGGVVLR